jgi:hypothetical protein
MPGKALLYALPYHSGDHRAAFLLSTFTTITSTALTPPCTPSPELQTPKNCDQRPIRGSFNHQ